MAHIEFRETMSGAYRLLRDMREARPMSFTIRARSSGISRLLREPLAFIEGEVSVEGFADHRPLRGILGLDLMRTGRLPYAFSFENNDGRDCRFQGHKTIAWSNLVESMTVLPGRIFEREREIATATLRFDLQSDLGKFLRSFRAWR